MKLVIKAGSIIVEKNFSTMEEMVSHYLSSAKWRTMKSNETWVYYTHGKVWKTI